MPYNTYEKQKEYHDIRANEFTKKILDYKKENKCSKCGYNEHPEILQFHHLNKETKSFQINKRAYQRAWETILKEINKCILLCPNCHFWLHFQEKEWFMENARKKYYENLKK